MKRANRQDHRIARGREADAQFVRVREAAGRRVREHNRYDVQCDRYIGHNAVPSSIDIYTERCVVCSPYTDEEALNILRA